MRIAKIVAQTLMSNQLPMQPLVAQRDGRFAIEGEGASLWAREACRAVELCTCQPYDEVRSRVVCPLGDQGHR